MKSETIQIRELTPNKGTSVCQRVSSQPAQYLIHYRTPYYLRERNSAMPNKNNTLSAEQQAKLIELLNRRLADAIDLQLQSRQAYWNVKGPNFIALRELFDKVAEGVEEDANLIAGRIVQLGGTAEGTAHAVAGRSSLDRYSLATAVGNGHIDALAATLTDFGRHVRYA